MGPHLPKAHESLSGEDRAGTGICAGHSKRSSRRSGASSKEQDQRGRASARSEGSKECTPTEHGGSREGLPCPGNHFLPRNVQLLAG